MEKKITLKTFKVVVTILFFFCFTANKAQTLIRYQGFDSTSEDTWSYSNTLNTGTIQTNTSTYVSAPNSLRIGGSSSATPDDPFITMDNKSDTFYVIPNTDESTVRESIENKLKEMNTNIDIDIYVFIFPIALS